MTHVFFLLMLVCNSTNDSCQPRSGGYYRTEDACRAAKYARRHEMTDGSCMHDVCIFREEELASTRCKRVPADPN